MGRLCFNCTGVAFCLIMDKEYFTVWPFNIYTIFIKEKIFFSTAGINIPFNCGDISSVIGVFDIF